MKDRHFWQIMLILSIFLFIMTFYFNNMIFLLISLTLAFIVRIKGDKVIFKEYNKNREEKIKRLKELS
ncbi:hypothetical protein BT1A1_1060 [Caldibacillus thermoamylovorans]|jgi:chromate transport protein ChrA|uniref:Uncharacterized protein n=1 Tax=Caldibacillus thermoamylovorans TaxID=35841 RepID=A0A090IT98_9BACI|nr:hypothetical protein BT1A1_1060 [Caldibacillus thermoamylovorans]